MAQVLLLLAGLLMTFGRGTGEEFGGIYVLKSGTKALDICGGTATVDPVRNSTAGYKIDLGRCKLEQALEFKAEANGTLLWTGNVPCVGENMNVTHARLFHHNSAKSETIYDVTRSRSWDYLDIGMPNEMCVYYAKLQWSILDWAVPVVIVGALAICICCCCISTRIKKAANPRPPSEELMGTA